MTSMGWFPIISAIQPLIYMSFPILATAVMALTINFFKK